VDNLSQLGINAKALEGLTLSEKYRPAELYPLLTSIIELLAGIIDVEQLQEFRNRILSSGAKVPAKSLGTIACRLYNGTFIGKARKNSVSATIVAMLIALNLKNFSESSGF